MTKILFDLKETSPNGDVPIDAQINCYPVARRKDGTVLVTRRGFTVRTGFKPTVIDLHHTGLDGAWLITISSHNNDIVHGFYAVSKPNMTGIKETPIPFNDLIEVDPDTLEPTENPDPIWWAMARSTVTEGNVDSAGDLILTHYDGKRTNAGRVKGDRGERGLRGLPGQDGTNGADGSNGADGRDGVDGLNDAGVSNLIQTPASETASALSAAIGESLAVSPDVIPSTILKLTANPPVGFRGLTKLPTPKIRRTMQGVFTAELDIDALRPPAGVIYYTSPTASASADGLTPATPARVATIVAKPDVGTIICADGEYRRDIVANPAGGIPRSINWLAAPGAKPVFTGFNGVTATAWTLTSGNIYQTTRAATTSVLDVQNLTSWGDYTIYVKKADLASVTSPGQWSLVGSTVYVWALGSTDLSSGENRAQIRLQVSATSGVVAGADTTQYIEGIDFLGCASDTSSSVGGVVAQENSLVIAKNVKVKYNMASDGFTTRGGHMIAVDCESSSNDRDGMNYHDTPGNGGEFIEINCYSHHNGITTPGTNNATTAHEAVTGIRVNGNYDKSAGPVVADVNSAHTWNVGCFSGGTYAGLPADAGSWLVDASSYPTNPAKMWLDECTSDNALYAYRAGGENCKLYIHASGWGNPMRTDTPAFVTSYRRT